MSHKLKQDTKKGDLGCSQSIYFNGLGQGFGLTLYVSQSSENNGALMMSSVQTEVDDLVGHDFR